MEASAAIFAGGLLKWVVMRAYTAAKSGDEFAEARENGDNDTMLAGASVFAAGALVSIALVLLTTLFDSLNWDLFHLAGAH